MLATAILAQQLEHYHQLCFLQSAPLATQLEEVLVWQKQRMKRIHQPLFTLPHYQKISIFLLDHLYSHAEIIGLVNQLDKALKEHVKLDRFLSTSILDAAILSFELAYLTLKLDQEIARYLLDQQLKTNTDNIHRAIIELNQYDSRQQQLNLLAKLSTALYKYSHSLLIQTAFKFAKTTAYRRQFNFLYDYLTIAFTAVRATPQTKNFFKAFIQQETVYLDQVTATNASLNLAMRSSFS